MISVGERSGVQRIVIRCSRDRCPSVGTVHLKLHARDADIVCRICRCCSHTGNRCVCRRSSNRNRWRGRIPRGRKCHVWARGARVGRVFRSDSKVVQRSCTQSRHRHLVARDHRSVRCRAGSVRRGSSIVNCGTCSQARRPVHLESSCSWRSRLHPRDCQCGRGRIRIVRRH